VFREKIPQHGVCSWWGYLGSVRRGRVVWAGRGQVILRHDGKVGGGCGRENLHDARGASPPLCLPDGAGSSL